MSSNQQFPQISQSDIDHFLEHGWIKLSSCFTQEAADHITSSVWTRLDISPDDKSSWSKPSLNLRAGRINLPSHNSFSAVDFAPKAWSAICDLVGGEDKISAENRTWSDALIVNLGTPETEGVDIAPQKLDGWHVDGDFFVHFLDSPEQALLVIPLWSDIRAGGGGTFICPAAIPHIAKHLYDNPAGVSPRFETRAENSKMDNEGDLTWFNKVAATMPDEAFVEVTGMVGDVYLLHPYVLHSASNNKLREVRIITNPPVSLKEPFELERKDKQYSIVEQKTLKELGKPEGVGEWKITMPRDKIVPERVKVHARMKEIELQRLANPSPQASPKPATVQAAA